MTKHQTYLQGHSPSYRQASKFTPVVDVQRYPGHAKNKLWFRSAAKCEILMRLPGEHDMDHEGVSYSISIPILFGLVTWKQIMSMLDSTCFYLYKSFSEGLQMATGEEDVAVEMQMDIYALEIPQGHRSTYLAKNPQDVDAFVRSAELFVQYWNRVYADWQQEYKDWKIDPFLEKQKEGAE
jgi:hypothetical protein